MVKELIEIVALLTAEVIVALGLLVVASAIVGAALYGGAMLCAAVWEKVRGRWEM